MLAPLKLAHTYETVSAIKGSPQETTDLLSTLRGLPYRTRTVDSNKPSDLTNVIFLGTPGALARAFAAGAEKPAPFELGVEGGWLRFGDTVATTSLSLESRTTDIPSFNLFLRNRLHNGWAVGTSVTLNTWRHFSNEFSFDFQRGGYRLGASFSGFNGQNPAGYQEQTTGFLTNQFGYALLFNFRSREKRVRPYLTAGTAFQLLHHRCAV